MKNKISLSLRCDMLFAAYYMLIYPTIIMFSTYMILSGFSSVLVAELLSVFGIVSIIVKPLMASLIDKGKCRLSMISVLLMMAVGTAVFFYAAEKTVFHAFIYVLLVSALSGVVMESVDCWVLKLSTEDPSIDYGKSRSIGSFAFAFTSIIYGFLLARLGIEIAPVIIFILIALMIFISLLLPDARADYSEKKGIRDSLNLFRDKRFVFFLIFYAMGCSLIDLTDNYIGVLILEKGGTAAYTGIHDFFKAMIEFAVMFISTKIALRYGKINILCFGMVGLCIKGVLAAIMPTAALVVPTCISQAISFPLVIPARMMVLKDQIPEDQLALAVSLTGVSTAVFMTVILNPLMAYLIPLTSTSYAVMICSLFGIVSAVGLFLSQKERVQR